MPLYDFKCSHCSEGDEQDYTFTLSMPMSADRSAVTCPNCDKSDATARLFNVPAMSMGGLTASEKAAGTTKQRADMGKFMRDQRTKRKRQYGSNTREGKSNELWAGPLPEGFKAPEKPKGGHV
jgi:putative FmdB family regulatory protein